MLLRSNPYDFHIAALDNNLSLQQQITPYSADFLSLSSTNSDFELTLTLIIITDFLSVPKHVLTPIFLDSEVQNYCRIYM